MDPKQLDRAQDNGFLQERAEEVAHERGGARLSKTSIFLEDR